MESIANLFVDEGTLSGESIISLPWRARYIEIINDSSTKNLKYKFNSTQGYATLKPLEAVSPHIKSRKVYLSGTGPYRVRGEG